jgi:hypothetical protein
VTINDEPKISLAGALAFMAGAASPFSLSLVGELFWSELLLPVFALIALARSWPAATFSDSAFRSLVVASALTLMGYMISDLIAGTSPDQYLRGWSRVAVLVTNIFSLAVLCGRNPWVLCWFCAGWGFGGIVDLKFLQGLSISKWKFGFAEPLTLLAAAGCALLPRWMAAALLAWLGAHSVLKDYRSLGAILLICSVLSLMRLDKARSKGSTVKLVAIAVGGLIVMQATSALLGASRDDFSGRRAASDIGRFAALRVGSQAILDSPLIGYGSWGQGTEKYAEMMYEETRSEMVAIGGSNMLKHSKGFSPHSQILQAWMEGGLLGASFFFAFGYFIVQRGWNVVMCGAAGRFTSLALFLLLLGAWNFVMSPFNGVHRLNISLGAVALLVLCGGLVRQVATPVTGLVRSTLVRRPANLME